MDPMTLQQHLERAPNAGEGRDASRPEIQAIVSAIAKASIEIADLLSLGVLAGASMSDVALRAQAILVESLRGSRVRELASATSDAAIVLDEAAPFLLAIQPLAGSCDIDTNLPAGTIFALSDANAPAGEPLAAGFVVYGAHTTLALTLGDGVDIFTLDRRDGTFRLTAAKVRVLDWADEYAMDAANYRHWDAAARAFVDDCFNSADREEAQGFNMRWTGSLVAEAFHILLRGGVLLDPADARRGREGGRVRLVCEARPLAFVIEQAGGRASTGRARILDLPFASPQARTPFVFGSPAMVERIERLYARPESLADISPLFGKRGLFRA